MSNNAMGLGNCPALMSDGRLFTDYRPSCYVHDLMLKQNGITNSFDLKALMTNRGNELQQINRDYYASKAGCQSCPGYYLPDPNGHVNYWQRYGESIGYGNVMTLGCPATQPAAIPTILPPVAECTTGCGGIRK